jgi:hypothetical protein
MVADVITNTPSEVRQNVFQETVLDGKPEGFMKGSYHQNGHF